MTPRLLIAYATWTGATRGIAEAIGSTLLAHGWDVDVRHARTVDEIDNYHAVIVGTGVHAGQLPREIVHFVKRNRAALAAVPVAYFLACLTMIEDTPETRAAAAAYLDPLDKAVPDVKPVDIGLFAGAVLDHGNDYDRLFPLLKFPVRAMAKNIPDHRNWQAISAWAEQLAPKLIAAIQSPAVKEALATEDVVLAAA